MLTEGEHLKFTPEILKNDEKISLSVFLSASQTEVVSQSKVQGDNEWGQFRAVPCITEDTQNEKHFWDIET